jgi:hypothetical protein
MWEIGDGDMAEMALKLSWLRSCVVVMFGEILTRLERVTSA